jgi:hypothetical protein
LSHSPICAQYSKTKLDSRLRTALSSTRSRNRITNRN